MRRVVVYSDFNKEDIDYEGVFHGFGVDHEGFIGGQVGNYTIAIIERDNGKVETPCAVYIQFIKEPI